MLRHADVEQGVRRLRAAQGGSRGWPVRSWSGNHMPIVQVSLFTHIINAKGMRARVKKLNHSIYLAHIRLEIEGAKWHHIVKSNKFGYLRKYSVIYVTLKL